VDGSHNKTCNLLGKPSENLLGESSKGQIMLDEQVETDESEV